MSKEKYLGKDINIDIPMEESPSERGSNNPVLHPEIKISDGKNEDFAALCNLLDENLDELVGKEIQREKFAPLNKRDSIHKSVILYVDRKPVASGGLRNYDNNTAEIKRVFVKKDYRGKGLSKILMKELESQALKSGYTRLILETGKMLKTSIGLYKSIGFYCIENYGQYKNIPESLCMEKKLKK